MIPSASDSQALSRKIRVMIVEDHPLLIQGLRRVLEGEPDMVVVAEVSDGAEAVLQSIENKPDVILMDINLPEKNGLQATREIMHEQNRDDVHIIVLTAYHDQEQLYHAIAAGASAYYPKDVQPSELLPAIRVAASGMYLINGVKMNKTEAFRWLFKWVDAYSSPSAPTAKIEMISAREMEVLTLLTRGASNKELAYALNISLQTVKNHVSSLMRKLHVQDRTQAAVLALRRGWVRLEETTSSAAFPASPDTTDHEKKPD